MSEPSPATRLQRTPLYSRHVDAGAKIVPFAGFEMPVTYGSVIAEHRAVRNSAGLFDVSHMGEVRLRGSDANEFVQRIFSNDVAGLEAGRVRYGLICQPDGGVIDDVMLYRVAANELFVCMNASNIVHDLAWMRETHASENFECDLIDESEATGLIAIQGPRALEIAERLAGPDSRVRLGRFRAVELAGIAVQVSRGGYTGERGYELYVPTEHTAALWDALREAGGDALVPVGLGARDTLRTEMGYALYGHELDREHNGVEAGLSRVIAFDRDFIGCEALRAERERGPARSLVALDIEGRQVARAGFAIHSADEGQAAPPCGQVTSGTFGPSVERSIAIGYVPTPCAEPGTRLAVDIRGRRVACRVTTFPFFKRKA